MCLPSERHQSAQQSAAQWSISNGSHSHAYQGHLHNCSSSPGDDQGCGDSSIRPQGQEWHGSWRRCLPQGEGEPGFCTQAVQTEACQQGTVRRWSTAIAILESLTIVLQGCAIGLLESWIFSLHNVCRDRLPDDQSLPASSFCYFFWHVMLYKGNYVSAQKDPKMYKERKCSLLMQHCKVHSLQVNPFWGLQMFVPYVMTPAERLQILNHSQICSYHGIIL